MIALADVYVVAHVDAALMEIALQNDIQKLPALTRQRVGELLGQVRELLRPERTVSAPESRLGGDNVIAFRPRRRG